MLGPKYSITPSSNLKYMTCITSRGIAHKLKLKIILICLLYFQITYNYSILDF